MAQKPKPLIMDCTLRDGSYAIDFQFTQQQTHDIALALDAAGVPLIEIGHGIGLGASNRGLGKAACSDEAYMEAASSAVELGKWGVFCIPGVASPKDLDQALTMGAGFIRVGAEIGKVDDMGPFIKRVKEAGVICCANFMKSYAVAPDQFYSAASRAKEFGADYVYLVDSAGCMLQHEVSAYLQSLAELNIEVGFHGHNNLGLAVANGLFSAQEGVSIIDTSLQGMGRSAGNASTEQLVSALHRAGFDTGIDLLTLLDASTLYISEAIPKEPMEALDTIAGYTRFHSSYMPVILKYSNLYKIDPRQLIIEVCKETVINAPDELVKQKADALFKSGSNFTRTVQKKYHGQEQSR